MSGPCRVRWRIHVLAKHEARARRVVDRVAERLDRELRVESVERYWKLPEQQVVEAWSPLAATTFADAVVEVLQLAGRVAHRSTVAAPLEELDGQWSFEGAGGDFSVAGIEFLNWRLERISA